MTHPTLQEMAEKYAVQNEQATLNVERIKCAFLAGANAGLERAAEIALEWPVNGAAMAEAIREETEGVGG